MKPELMDVYLARLDDDDDYEIEEESEEDICPKCPLGNLRNRCWEDCMGVEENRRRAAEEAIDGPGGKGRRRGKKGKDGRSDGGGKDGRGDRGSVGGGGSGYGPDGEKLSEYNSRDVNWAAGDYSLGDITWSVKDNCADCCYALGQYVKEVFKMLWCVSGAESDPETNLCPLLVDVLDVMRDMGKDALHLLQYVARCQCLKKKKVFKIDKNGYRVDKYGNRFDKYGHRVDKYGDIVEEEGLEYCET